MDTTSIGGQVVHGRTYATVLTDRRCSLRHGGATAFGSVDTKDRLKCLDLPSGNMSLVAVVVNVFDR